MASHIYSVEKSTGFSDCGAWLNESRSDANIPIGCGITFRSLQDWVIARRQAVRDDAQTIQLLGRSSAE